MRPEKAKSVNFGSTVLDRGGETLVGVTTGPANGGPSATSLSAALTDPAHAGAAESIGNAVDSANADAVKERGGIGA